MSRQLKLTTVITTVIRDDLFIAEKRIKLSY